MLEIISLSQGTASLVSFWKPKVQQLRHYPDRKKISTATIISRLSFQDITVLYCTRSLLFPVLMNLPDKNIRGIVFKTPSIVVFIASENDVLGTGYKV
jgi:hypothetical protein